MSRFDGRLKLPAWFRTVIQQIEHRTHLAIAEKMLNHRSCSALTDNDSIVIENCLISINEAIVNHRE